MNVLHILPWTSFGGVPGYVKGLLKGLRILGHKNVCVGLNRCFEVYRRYCSVSVSVEDRLSKTRLANAIPDTIKIYLYQILKLDFSHVLNETDVDSVIINNDPRAIPLNDVVKLGIPIIRVQHGTYMNYLYWYRYLPIPAIDRIKELNHTLFYHYGILRYLRKISREYPKFYIVAVSERTRKELVYYDVPPSKVYVITGGVDKDVFKPLPKEYARKVVRHKLGIDIDEDDKVLLHVGLSPRKGTHVLLKAFNKISSTRKVELIIVGSLKSEYGRILLEFIQRSALHKNTVIVRRVPDDLMPFLYNAADIVVQPSYSEGCSLTLLESLACGTPVVTTNVGCSDDYLKTMGLCDLLIRISEPDFSDELSDKIMYVLENKEYFQRKVLSNCDKVPSWTDVAKQYVNLVDYLK